MAERYYYLAQWDEPDDPLTDYAPPQGVVGLFDTTPLTGVKYGFFTTDRQLTDDDWTGIDTPDWHDFGDGTDLREYHTSQSERDEWRSLLDLSTGDLSDADVDTLYDALVLTFRDCGDPDHEQRFKPPTATHSGEVELHLGGHSLLWRHPSAHLPQAAQDNIFKRVQNDMARSVEQCRRRGPGPPTPEDPTPDEATYRRVATKWADKYSLDIDTRGGRRGWGRLFPPDLRGNVEPPMEPQTSYIDSFTDTDGTALSNHTSDGGYSWSGPYRNSDDAIINSDALTGPGTDGPANHRLEADLSTEDQYSEAFVDSIEGTTGITGVLARFAPDEETYYWGMAYNPEHTDELFLRKVETGTVTNLDSVVGPPSTNPDVVIRLEADGSTISVLWGGTEELSVTDTSIADHPRTGIGVRYANDVVDDWEAGDIMPYDETGHRDTLTLHNDGAADALYDQTGQGDVLEARNGGADIASHSAVGLGDILIVRDGGLAARRFDATGLGDVLAVRDGGLAFRRLDATGLGDALVVREGGHAVWWQPPMVGVPDPESPARLLTWPDARPGEMYVVVIDGQEHARTAETELELGGGTEVRQYLQVTTAVEDLEGTPTPMDRVQLEWEGDAARYRIERAPIDGSYSAVATTTETRYVSEPLEDYVWYFKVVAVDEQGDEAESDSVALEVASTPEPPASLDWSWDEGDQQLTLSWNESDSSDVASYRVRCSEGAEALDPTSAPVQDSLDTSYSRTFSDETGMYIFSVRAVDEDGMEEANVRRMVALPFEGGQLSGEPSAPRSVEAEPVSDGKVEVSWIYDPTREYLGPGMAQEARIYGDGGTGTMDWDTPVATVDMGGPERLERWSWTSGQLTDGQTYQFAVRIATDTHPAGRETQNTDTHEAVPDSEVPATPALRGALV